MAGDEARTDTVPRPVTFVANGISLARLLVVPLAVWLILRDQLLAAFWIFVAAGISDAADGLVAKHFDAETVIGGYLDPLADKALLVSVYVSLGVQGYLPLWLVILVVFRDALIIGGAILFQLLTRALEMQPLMISKVNTVAQIVLAALVLGVGGFGLDGAAGDAAVIMIYVVAATTLLSGAAYVVTWTRRTVAMEDRP